MSEREEYAKIIAFAGRSAHDVSASADQYWQHLNVENQDTARRQADAIMSAFKRASGVVDADEIARAIHEARCVGASCTVDFDMLDGCEDAQYLDALRRDAEAVAKRITSAVEPSCVATDEMVEAHPRYQSLLSEFAARGQHNDALIEVIREASKAEETCKLLAGIRSTWAGRDPAACVIIAKAEEKLAAQAAIISGETALTAALSSRTDEEREIPAYIRERADEEIAQIKASIGRDEQGQSDLPFAEVSGSDALRRRSLTNGGE